MGLEQVRLLVLDHDGVLTDNHVYVDQDGRESCRYYRGDGVGIERVKALGVQVIVLSGERNPVVQARCEKLRLPCYQDVTDKLNFLTGLLSVKRMGWEQVAYLGNDVNDVLCLQAVGCPVVTVDCEPAVKRTAMQQHWLITTRPGGSGAVREFCDYLAASIEASRVAVGAD